MQLEVTSQQDQKSEGKMDLATGDRNRINISHDTARLCRQLWMSGPGGHHMAPNRNLKEDNFGSADNANQNVQSKESKTNQLPD